MYNQQLIRTLEDRFDKLQAYLFRSFDGEEDLYSFIASIIYDKDYEDCCYWKNGKPNPEGKELRDRVKQFLIPVIEECGGITDEKTEVVSQEKTLNSPLTKIQINDFDMQIRIIKGDLQYLADKVNELSSLLEEQKIKGENGGSEGSQGEWGEWIRLDSAKRVIAKFKGYLGYLDEDMIERIQIALAKESEADHEQTT